MSDDDNDEFVVPRKSEEEIYALARDIVTNRVYVAWDEEMLISFQFMMLAIAANRPPAWIEDVGLAYEYLDKAGERGINGYPMFFSIQFVHKDDVWSLRRTAMEMAISLGLATQEELDEMVAAHEAGVL